MKSSQRPGLLFSVEGPLQVGVLKGPGGRVIRSEEGTDFFRRHSTLGARRGCYVFAIRTGGKGATGGTMKPWYVGKATKTFSQECFADHKLTKYNECLAMTKKGTPVLFLVTAPKGKGKPPTNLIAELEAFLIQAAMAQNENILNVKGTKTPRWAIHRVTEPGKGKPPKSAFQFRKTMGLGH